MKNTIELANSVITQVTGSSAASGLLLLASPSIILALGLYAYKHRSDIKWYLWGVHAFTKWEESQEKRVAFLTRCGVTRSVALSTALAETIRDRDFILRAGESEHRARCINKWMRNVTEELHSISNHVGSSSIERASATNAIKLHSEALVTHEFRKMRALQA